PMEHVLRQCLLALRTAELLGLEDEQRSTTYYTALLVGVGCHTDAHEQAKWFGDDIAMKSHKYDHKMPSIAGMAQMIGMVGAGHQPLHRFRIGLELAVSGFRDLDGMIASHARMASALAREVGLPIVVQDSVGSAYERWDGKGYPGVLKAGQIPIEARIAQISEFVEVAHRLGGADAVAQICRERAGRQFDPEISQAIVTNAASLLDGVDETTGWNAVIDAEPTLGVRLTSDEADRALVGVADFIDLKTPYLLGHARAVGDLCSSAAMVLGMARPDVVLLRRAGWVHGFGRLGISNAIWDKPSSLAAGERERVRLHPYLTERMLQQSEWLSPLAAIAVQLRERLDGSGYPRGLSGASISMPARVLAAADVYQSMCEPRPYRPARTPAEAARELKAEVNARRLDGDAVAAVLTSAGHAVARRREYPAGLTSREVDVLRLVARGMSSRAIAERLVISPKTARNHIEHIYTKIGASNRASASLFAVQAGLLPENEQLAAES
ncbi:MAG TPA: HD domain-containing phosphohydrolase, partial [Mycobacteriales bacterium]|nr:HD domain-containing phosphohydrolase [Mycobacteriales bacterium]